MVHWYNKMLHRNKKWTNSMHKSVGKIIDIMFKQFGHIKVYIPYDSIYIYLNNKVNQWL